MKYLKQFFLILFVFTISIVLYSIAYAQSYCGSALRIDKFNCTLVNNGVSKYCQKTMLDDSYTANCTGNPNSCTTTSQVSGNNDGCVLHEGGTRCDAEASYKSCWVNPGDDPPPPPVSNAKCGATCTSSDQCNGLTCAPAGVCWGTACDTGDPVSNHRVRVKVVNCNNNPAANVRVAAPGWNGCTTNQSGECIVAKGTACKDSQWTTSILVGHDADANDPNYYSNDDYVLNNKNPFERGSCGEINCRKNISSTMSNPLRYGYEVSKGSNSVDMFTWLFCSTSDADANTGFNFKQINCPTANAFPNISISGPSSGVVGTDYTWNLSASDADDGVDIFGAYIGAGTSPSSWTQLNYTDLPTPVAQKDDSTSPWTCTTPGTYTIAVFAKDAAGQHCSGNPTGSAQRCASNPNDRKTFTCNPVVPDCTGVTISCSGQCINSTSTPKQSRYTCTWAAPNGSADTAFAMKLRSYDGSSWGTYYYKTSSLAADASLFTKSGNNWTFTYNPSSLGGLPDLQRGFATRVYDSSACIEKDSAYGTERTVGTSCASTPSCSGPAIICGGVCNASGVGSFITCDWTKPAGADNFLMQFKSSSSSIWNTDTATTGDASRWTKNFTTDVSRDFRLKIKASNSCTPNSDDAAGGYGPNSTVSAPVCTSYCAGPAIICGGTCNASGAGYTANCTWTKPSNANNFLMQYKTSSSTAWTTDTANTGDANSWSKSFTTDVSRDFRLKIKASSVCTPNSDDAAGGYGQTSTIPAPVCASAGSCPGVLINCSNTCNASSGYDVICTWTKPSNTNNFEMQYKNSNASIWTTDTPATGNVTTWTKAFVDPTKARDFRLRVSGVTTAATCTVDPTAFGPVSSVGALTCTADAPPNLTFNPPATSCANQALSLSATATDTDGIQKVEFAYKRNNQSDSSWTTHTDTTSPYSYSIPANTLNAATTYNLRAIATDNDSPSMTTTLVKNITIDTVANCSSGTSSFTINKVKTSSKAIPDSGDTVTFRIDVENTGTTTLNNLSVTETVPSYTTFRPASSAAGWTCENINAGARCTFPTIDSLAPGATQSTTFAVRVIDSYKQAGVNMATSNTACADFTSQNEKCDTLNIDLADQSAGSTSISINKTIDTNKSATTVGGYTANDAVVFDLTITNTGTTTLNGINLSETVPARMNFVSNLSSNGWSCTNSACSLPLGSTTLAPGSSLTYEFGTRVRNNYVPTAGQNMTTTNEACTTATGASQACDTLIVDLADAEETNDPTLVVTKTISTANSATNPPYGAGDKIAFAIQINNNNSTSLTGLNVSDTIPQYTTFDATTSNSLSPGNATWSCTGNNCTFNAGSLNASSSKTVYFVVDVDSGYTPGNGNMQTNNEACVTSTEVTNAVCDDINADLEDGSNASAILQVSQVLDTAKTGKSEPYAASDVVFVEISVRNNSNVQATNVVLTDTIVGNKARQSVASAQQYNSGVWSCSTNKICTYTIGNIPANTTRTYYFAEIITSYSSPVGANATTTNNACAIGNNATEDCASLSIDLVDNVSAPSFVIRQNIVNQSSSPFDAGDDIQFNIEVENTGNVQLSNVAIADQLSNLVTFNDSATTSNWSCSGTNCSLAVGFLNAGATYTADIVLKVKPDYFTVGGFNYGDDARGTNRVTATEALLPSVTDNIAFDLVDLTTQPTTFVGYIHYLEEGQSCDDINDSNRLTVDKLDITTGQNPRLLFEFTDTPPTSININPYNYSSGFDVEALRDIPLPLDARIRVALSNLNNLNPSIPGEFEFPCARFNGAAMGKANANRTNYIGVNEGATNTILIGLRIKPFKPWFQLEEGDIYTGGQVIQSLPTPPSPKMITNEGNLFSDGGAFTGFSAKGVNVRNFLSAGASSWLNEFGFEAANGDSISGSTLQSKVYRGSAGDLNNWLANNSTYSVSGDDLAVYFVTGTGDLTFANSNGLSSSNNGRLLIITKGNVIFEPTFGQNSSGIAGEFGILAEGSIDFIHQTGVNPVPDILRLEGMFASGTGGGINITRRCALNETQPSIIFTYDDSYYEKINEFENAHSYSLGMTQVEVTNWEVLD